MIYEETAELLKHSMRPHELFLINLIFNHILLFVAVLSVARSYPLLVVIVPVISLSIMSYILWRAKSSLHADSWYVMCHWQVTARYSRLFIAVLGGLILLSCIGWLLHKYMGVRDIAIYAFIGGFVLLPTMVSVLLLILLESDSLHMARQGKLPKWVVARYPAMSA